MVKPDSPDDGDFDKADLKSIEHVGVVLWRAAEHWRHLSAEELAARGYPWHREARGMVLAHLGPSGRSQTQLTTALRMSKQAVQQLVDQLEKDGVVRRVPDPDDKRAKRIELTALGLRDFAERNKVKRMIEADYRAKLGDKLFGQMMQGLQKLIT